MRLKLAYAVISIFFIMLIARSYYISIISHDYYEKLSRQNAWKNEYTLPTRGSIFDRFYKPLAVNRLGFSISVVPHLLTSKTKQAKLDSYISLIKNCFPDIDEDKLRATYVRNDSPYNQEYIEILDFLDYKKSLACFTKISLIEDLKIEVVTRRLYPNDSVASHIIGYVAKANATEVQDLVVKHTKHLGKSGIERFYNSTLQGKLGERKMQMTALGNKIGIEDISKPSSEDIVLSIDLKLQKYITELFNNRSGAAIVMDVNSGEILAAASLPEYDLNPFVSGISKDEWQRLSEDLEHPFTNKLVNGLYPPGSIIKMGVAMSFLESGKINETDSVVCSGFFELGGRKFRCHKLSGHGRVDLHSAIMYSCDDYFYKNSLRVGIDTISSTLMKFGLGSKTNIDLPNEFVGLVPNRSWKLQKYKENWYQGESLITSIGQGYFLVTPMQIASYTSSIATGKKVEPHLAIKIGQEYNKKHSTDFLSDVQKAKLKRIQKAMYDTANVPGATAYRSLSKARLHLGAKTGTAQVTGIPQHEKRRIKEQDMAYYSRSHAWMNAYGPWEKPQYAVVVLVEHGGHGGSTAGPLVADIFNKLLELGYIDRSFERPLP